MKFCWVTINVCDMEKSIAFYRDVVGLTMNRRMAPRPGIEIAFMGEAGASSTGTEVELYYDAANARPSYSEDLSLGFRVESVEKTMAMLERKGVKVHSGPFQPNPHLKFVFVQDPDGVKIQFVENL
jgi:lactoylglutathione lyase